MKKFPFIFFAAVSLGFLSCTGNNQQPASDTALDSINNQPEQTAMANSARHVNWEIGDSNNVKKILELYQLWDQKKAFVMTDYFADTITLHIPDVDGAIIIPNNKISEKLGENREGYQATSNNILSSVSLHDKTTGEDWVMVTAYSKWTESDGKKDSVLYHDDWKLVNGKVDRLISFYKVPPKGFVPKTDK